MTKAIVEIAKPLGIAVHDHIIVGKNGHASLKGLKLIYKTRVLFGFGQERSHWQGVDLDGRRHGTRGPWRMTDVLRR
jgi:hypothetical protein